MIFEKYNTHQLIKFYKKKYLFFLHNNRSLKNNTAIEKKTTLSKVFIVYL